MKPFLSNPKEKYIEQSLVRKVKGLNGLCIKLIPVSGRGLPDRLVLLPGGQMSFVELKAPGGRLSPHQVYWHRLLKERGYEVVTLWSTDHVNRWINEQSKRTGRTDTGPVSGNPGAGTTGEGHGGPEELGTLASGSGHKAVLSAEPA